MLYAEAHDCKWLTLNYLTHQTFELIRFYCICNITVEYSCNTDSHCIYVQLRTLSILVTNSKEFII